MDYTYQDIAKMIDHSLLVPSLTERDLEAGCRLAVEYGVASAVMVPYALAHCVPILNAGGVKASTTIGFPHGIQTTEVKLVETRRALDDGGEELDMVVNISQVLSGQWDTVSDELVAIAELIHDRGAMLKVIFENCYLQDEHKIRLCDLCARAGADWVKTSTGFAPGGAVLADIVLMRTHAPPHVQVKAAGGVKTLDQVLDIRAAGATRVGVSATAEILDECKRRLAT